jgi:predicted phosphodiesterase
LSTRRGFFKRFGAAAALLFKEAKAQRSSISNGKTPDLTLQPFLARPTDSSILINARNGPLKSRFALEIRNSGDEEWRSAGSSILIDANSFVEWEIDDLDGGCEYEYRLNGEAALKGTAQVAQGRFVTQRSSGSSYIAALMTDSHMGTFDEGSNEVNTFDDVLRNIVRDEPDFVIALGDNVAWGGSRSSRNWTQNDSSEAKRAYEMYRRHMAVLSPISSYFGVIGNWEGESGKFPRESIENCASIRRKYCPNPDSMTYDQGGSENQDYYAFTWGDVLWIILNVQSYTTSTKPAIPAVQDVGVIEDWTLGEAQVAWLQKVLQSSRETFKFICIHHVVGGNGGDEWNTLYGRGGGRAVNSGEQKTIHSLMIRYGVQALFYGHDHVFVHDIVDGIHYVLPGSCGAPWKFDEKVTGYRKYWTDSGHARLRVSPKEVQVEFINQKGDTIDGFAIHERG